MYNTIMYSFFIKHMRYLVWGILVVAMLPRGAASAHHDARYYDPGSPVFRDIWVDPVAGADSNDGMTSATALAHVSAAWEQIPADVPLTTTGYRIWLQPGTYDASQIPARWQGRSGTAQYPIEIRAASRAGSVTFTQALDFVTVAYIYLYDIAVAPAPAATYALSCHECSYVVVRGSAFQGGGIVATQSHHMAIEDSQITNSPAAGVLWSAVRESHIQNTQIQTSGAACMQLNAGSATIRIEASTMLGCGTYGVVTGPESTLEPAADFILCLLRVGGVLVEIHADLIHAFLHDLEFLESREVRQFLLRHMRREYRAVGKNEEIEILAVDFFQVI